MLKTLDQFRIGETGLIKRVEGEGKFRHRLLDMGVTPGAEVYLRKMICCSLLLSLFLPLENRLLTRSFKINYLFTIKYCYWIRKTI